MITGTICILVSVGVVLDVVPDRRHSALADDKIR
jgi:hypothetical protein